MTRFYNGMCSIEISRSALKTLLADKPISEWNMILFNVAYDDDATPDSIMNFDTKESALKAKKLIAIVSTYPTYILVSFRYVAEYNVDENLNYIEGENVLEYAKLSERELYIIQEYLN